MNTTNLYVENLIVGFYSLLLLTGVLDLAIAIGSDVRGTSLSSPTFEVLATVLAKQPVVGGVVVFAATYVLGILTSRFAKSILRLLIENRKLRYVAYDLCKSYLPDALAAEVADDPNRGYQFVRAYVRHVSAPTMTALDYDRSMIRISRSLAVIFCTSVVVVPLHLWLVEAFDPVASLLAVPLFAILTWLSYRYWRDVTSEYHQNIGFAYLACVASRTTDVRDVGRNKVPPAKDETL